MEFLRHSLQELFRMGMKTCCQRWRCVARDSLLQLNVDWSICLPSIQSFQFSFLTIVFEYSVLLDRLWHVLYRSLSSASPFFSQILIFESSPDHVWVPHPYFIPGETITNVVEIGEWLNEWIPRTRILSSAATEGLDDERHTLTAYASCPFCRATIILDTHIQ